MEQFQHSQDLNIYTSCRTCLQNISDTQMYHDIFAIQDLQQKLTLCSSLPVEPDDGLPIRICESCHAKVLDFYNFQQMCIFARTRFQEFVNLELEVHPNNPNYYMNFTIIKKETEEDDPIPSKQPTQPSTENTEQSERTHLTYGDFEITFKEEPLLLEEHQQLDISSSNHINDKAESSEGSQPQSCEYNIVYIKEEPLTNFETEVNEKTPSFKDNSKHISNGRSKRNKGLANTTTSHENEFTCKICKKYFKNPKTFQVHMLLHKGLKPYSCDMCDKSYARQNLLETHIKATHKKMPAKQFPCTAPECDSIFLNKQTLRNHMKNHMQSYVCKECGKVQQSLDAHKRHCNLHTGEKLLHECSLCHKRFSTKGVLREHLNRHNGVKNHVCPHCGIKKITWRDLNKHLNSHTKEKKYPCRFCEMIYYNVHNLNRHTRIVHEGIKKYACSYCEKSFGRSETRKHHEMIHTGERPHECEICKKRFIQVISLKKHREIHFNPARKSRSVLSA